MLLMSLMQSAEWQHAVDVVQAGDDNAAAAAAAGLLSKLGRTMELLPMFAALRLLVAAGPKREWAH